MFKFMAGKNRICLLRSVSLQIVGNKLKNPNMQLAVLELYVTSKGMNDTINFSPRLLVYLLLVLMHNSSSTLLFVPSLVESEVTLYFGYFVCHLIWNGTLPENQKFKDNLHMPHQAA